MSKDTNPALAEHTVPDAPAAPVSQVVQTIPPAQAAVEIPQFASPTQEARYHILQYLTKIGGYLNAVLPLCRQSENATLPSAETPSILLFTN